MLTLRSDYVSITVRIVDFPFVNPQKMSRKATIPPVFKPLTPFIRRAEELEHDKTRGESQLVAFYCRQFAMEMGIKLRENDESEAATSFLLGMMDELEKEKEKMPEFSSEEAKVNNFSCNL